MTSIRNHSPFSSCARKIKLENLSPKDTIIILMGSAGSGKDNFLRVATGLELVEATKFSAIRVSWPELSESDICFLDTQAFDAKMSDEQIATTISKWSSEIYRKNVKLEGLLYFHRISDTQPAKTFMKNPQYFRSLVKFDRFILTTTMWDEVDGETGNRCEEQIRANWKALIDHGSSVKRFRYDRASIFEILSPIIREVNKRNEECLKAEISVLGSQLEKDPSGRSLFPEIKQARSQLQRSVESIRDRLMQPPLSHGEVQKLTTEYQKMHVGMQRAVDGMQRIGFSMGEWLQMATRQLNWEPFIWETMGTNIERQGNRIFKEEGPWNGPGFGRDYDSWKEFEQWKEFEKWKEFKQWREYEQWMKYKQRRMPRHVADEQQQVRVGKMRATEDKADTDSVAEAGSEQGNGRQKRSAESGSPSVSLSKKKQNEEYAAPRTATSVIGSQSTVAPPKAGGLTIASKSTPAAVTLTFDGSGGANAVGGSPVASKSSRRSTPGGANESTARPGPSTNSVAETRGPKTGRQQTASTTGGQTATDSATDTSASEKSDVSARDSIYDSRKTAPTSSAGRLCAITPSGGTTATATAEKPKDVAAVVPKGDYGKPSSDGVTSSNGVMSTSSDRHATTTTVTGGSSTTGVTTSRNTGGRAQNPTATTTDKSGQAAGVNFTSSIGRTSASQPGTSEGSKPTSASGGQSNAVQSAGYQTNASLPSSSPGSSPRGQSSGTRRSGITASSTATEQSPSKAMDTIWERQHTAGSQASQPSAAVTVAQGGSPRISAESRSAQDGRGKNLDVHTEQGGGEQRKSVNRTSALSSALSSNRNQNEGHMATGVATGGRPSSAGVTQGSAYSNTALTNDGGVAMASRPSRRPSQSGELPPVMALSASFGSRTATSVSQQEHARQQELLQAERERLETETRRVERERSGSFKQQTWWKGLGS